MANQEYDAIIVGGGHNGLVAAYYLAKEGLSVLVLERLEKVGGAVSTEELYPGFHVPYCAYNCHMLHGRVIEDLELRKFGFDLYNPEPERFQPFPDGTSLLTWRDHRKAYQEIAKFSEHDAQSWHEWNAFWQRAGGIFYRYFLTEPPTLAQIAEDVRGTADEEVWEKMLTVSMRDLVDEYFEDEHVKAVFINAGDSGDPSAPGSIMTVALSRSGTLGKAENRGIQKGGIGQITQAMAKSAQAQGVEIRTGATVKRVLVENGEARGVVLANGQEIRSTIVVSNADPKRTYLTLVEPKDLDEAFVRRVKNLKTRANCVKVLAALKEFPDFSRYLGPGFDPRLAVSTRICPTVDWAQASWDACKNGQLTRTPIMSLQFPSTYDRTLVPRGGHVMSIWVLYYPTQLKDASWDSARKEVGETLLDILSQYAPNIRQCVLELTVQTPMDIEGRVGLTDGNIRHTDQIPQQLFGRRMPYRSPIGHLYLCSSGTHPGGELTGGPGHNCAKAILKDISEPAPSYAERPLGASV